MFLINRIIISFSAIGLKPQVYIPSYAVRSVRKQGSHPVCRARRVTKRASILDLLIGRLTRYAQVRLSAAADLRTLIWKPFRYLGAELLSIWALLDQRITVG